MFLAEDMNASKLPPREIKYWRQTGGTKTRPLYLLGCGLLYFPNIDRNVCHSEETVSGRS
jgi:hypothetical protein